MGSTTAVVRQAAARGAAIRGRHCRSDIALLQSNRGVHGAYRRRDEPGTTVPLARRAAAVKVGGFVSLQRGGGGVERPEMNGGRRGLKLGLATGTDHGRVTHSAAPSASRAWGAGRARVLIAALHYHPDQPGGSGKLAFDEATFLASRGHEVWMLALDMTGENPEYAFRDGLHVLQYGVSPLRWLDPRRAFVHQKEARRTLAQQVHHPFDVVHGHTPLQYWGAVEAVAGHRWCYSVHSLARLELLASSRGLPALQRWKAHLAGRIAGRIERRCLKASDCVTSDSEFTHRLLRQHYGSKLAGSVKIVPGWVDMSRFQIVVEREAVKQRLGWPIEKPVLFTLRRLVPRMGLDNLLRAAREVADRGLEFALMIGGDGLLRGRLETLANDLGLAGRVRFLGRVSDDMLPQMFGAADAFVLPTAELEGFGLIILEALACGRPVLATPVGAIPEIITLIEPTWLSTDGSAGAIADLLASFLTGALPAHNPWALRARIEKRYSSSRILGELEALLLRDVDQSAQRKSR